jgi:hypothetical protein
MLACIPMLQPQRRRLLARTFDAARRNMLAPTLTLIALPLPTPCTAVVDGFGWSNGVALALLLNCGGWQ